MSARFYWLTRRNRIVKARILKLLSVQPWLSYDQLQQQTNAGMACVVICVWELCTTGLCDVEIPKPYPSMSQVVLTPLGRQVALEAA